MKKNNNKWFIISGIIIVVLVIIILAAILTKNPSSSKTPECISGYNLENNLCITEKTDYYCTGNIIPTTITGRGDYICDYPIYDINSITNYKDIISKNETLFVRGKIWKQYPINQNPVAQLLIDSEHPYSYFDVQTFDIVNSSVPNIPVIIDDNAAVGNYKITLKVKNPQYKQGSEIFFIYQIENLDNNTIIIPMNIKNGIEIKNSDGSAARSYDSSDKLIILNEDLNIPPIQKISSEFSIKGDDFELTGLNPTDGSYYAVSIYIGNVKSNKAMVRILK